eukprot:CAMPEP_0197901548 /NCGR_PEP_ID=MMETSP1439-20131203/51290_1 /TAXON_ID=66791 /ORGANISM="Gonyaulax spinifera, Strain CCMP409" /LENGTH=171 /DNA_ID=CAMNT_0043522521 /DNA_START=67 /DNA_END=579 /DNA_ORIENTATION=+
MTDDINELLVLFLKCVVFTVLRVRGVYPEESFKRQSVMGHPCWWSTCSEVEDYVSTLCDTLRSAVARHRLRRVLIPIHEASGLLRERYAVEFMSEPQRLASCSPEDISHALGLALTKLEMSPMVLGPNGAAGVPVDPRTSPAPPSWCVQVETRAPSVEEAPREEALGPRWN